MDDPTTASDPEPRRGSQQLDRAPGARYQRDGGEAPPASATTRAGIPPRAVVRAVIVADLTGAVGALLIFGLGLLDVGAGLIAVAAGVGWAVTLALLWSGGPTIFPVRATRIAVAVSIGAVAVMAGFLVDWAWARVEGGVLDPVSYIGQRYGPLALLILAAAVVAAALRAR